MLDQSNRAEFQFNITVPGTYAIVGGIYAPNGSDNSFRVTVDGVPSDGYLWDTIQSTTYADDYVNDRNVTDQVLVTLDAGPHTVTIHRREDGTRLDDLRLELQ